MNITDAENSELSQNKKLATFENRWRFAVVPAMVAFFMLFACGFYLIYSMLDRMQALSKDIARMTQVISESLPVMQGGIVGMSSKMQKVGDDLNSMANDVHDMSSVLSKTMPSMELRLVDMATNINLMSYSAAAMAATTDNMGRNIWSMNRSISKPMSFLSDMMPWQSSNNQIPPPTNYAIRQPYPYTRVAVRRQAAAIQPTQKLLVGKPVLTVSASKANTKGKNHFEGYCASCHGINAEGGVGPSLTNQSAEKISNILFAYKDGKRTGTMTGVTNTLSPREINNIANYLEENYYKPYIPQK